MNHGELVLDGTPKKVFRHREELRKIGLDIPQSANVLWELKERGIDVDTDGIIPEQAAKNIAEYLRRKA